MSKELGEWLASQSQSHTAVTVPQEFRPVPTEPPRKPRLWLLVGVGVAVVGLIVAVVIVALTLNSSKSNEATEAALQRIDARQQQLSEVEADHQAAELLVAVQQHELREMRTQMQGLQEASDIALSQSEKETLFEAVNEVSGMLPTEVTAEESAAVSEVASRAGNTTVTAPLTWLDASIEHMRSYLALDPVTAENATTHIQSTDIDVNARLEKLGAELEAANQQLSEMTDVAAQHSLLAAQLSNDLTNIGVQLPDRARVIAAENPDVSETHQPMYDAADRATILANATETVRLGDGQVVMPGDLSEIPVDAVVLPLSDAKRAQLMLGVLQSFVDAAAVVSDAQAVAQVSGSATAVMPGGVVPNPVLVVPSTADEGGSQSGGVSDDSELADSAASADAS